MSNICIIPSCNTRRSPYKNKTDTIKCFSFPKDPVQKKLWLQLCQVNDDHNRKVCVKHFKEDDFVDGLKARLMCVQPTRLKKDAVPSLFLSTEIISEEVKQKQIQNQEEMLQKYICKDKTPVIDVKTNPTNKRSIEYLSKLIPIAPKVQELKKGTIITQKGKLLIAKPKDRNITIPKERLLSLKKHIASKETSKPPKERIIAPKSSPISSKVPLLQQWPNIAMKQQIKRTKNKTDKGNANLSKQQNSKQLPKTVTLTQENKSEQVKESEPNIVYKVQAGLPFYQNKILQHDNAIYKKRIDNLVDTQNKLLVKIKDLKAEIESQKGDFISKVKEAFAPVLTPNQIDNILGKKKRIWWSDDEYSKALQLLQISKQAYKYVRDIMNYPIPHVENVHKWSIKHGQNKLQKDKNKQNNDENKENSCADDDQTIHDVDVKGEMKVEEVNTDGETETTRLNQNLDKDFIKTNELNMYQYCIVYENNHKEQSDKSTDQNNETNHVTDNDNQTNNDNEVLENNHESTMNEVCQSDDKLDDQQETDITMDDGNSIIYDNGDGEDYYEELIIDNDYSDDEMVCDQNEFTGKDNG